MLRKIVLKLLKYFERDIIISHHYTGSNFFLSLYKHKGYWYFGKNREKCSMEYFKKLIKEGDTVIEVGGHIGYISNYFSSLVGDSGKVIIFEPGPNNLPYLEKNTSHLSNVKIVKKGVGDVDGNMTFYVENLTGQNNTLVKNFTGFETNKQSSIEKDADYKAVEIEVIKLDTFLDKEREIRPSFIKIDVEGFEFEVLVGGFDAISKFRPSIMVEVQSNFEYIYDYFEKLDYNFYFENGVKIDNFESFCDVGYMGSNRFLEPKLK